MIIRRRHKQLTSPYNFSLFLRVLVDQKVKVCSRCGSRSLPSPPPPSSEEEEEEGGAVVSEWRRNLASALEKKVKERRWFSFRGAEKQLRSLKEQVWSPEDEGFVQDENCWACCVDAVSSSDVLFFCSGEFRWLWQVWLHVSVVYFTLGTFREQFFVQDRQRVPRSEQRRALLKSTFGCFLCEMLDVFTSSGH